MLLRFLLGLVGLAVLLATVPAALVAFFVMTGAVVSGAGGPGLAALAGVIVFGAGVGVAWFFFAWSDSLRLQRTK